MGSPATSPWSAIRAERVYPHNDDGPWRVVLSMTDDNFTMESGRWYSRDAAVRYAGQLAGALGLVQQPPDRYAAPVWFTRPVPHG